MFLSKLRKKILKLKKKNYENDIETAQKLRKMGWMRWQIAIVLNKPESTIRYWLREN